MSSSPVKTGKYTKTGEKAGDKHQYEFHSSGAFSHYSYNSSSGSAPVEKKVDAKWVLSDDKKTVNVDGVAQVKDGKGGHSQEPVKFSFKVDAKSGEIEDLKQYQHEQLEEKKQEATAAAAATTATTTTAASSAAPAVVEKKA